MRLIDVLFYLACAFLLGAAVFLVIYRGYKTGALGVIGLAGVAFGSMSYIGEALAGQQQLQPFIGTQVLVIGAALLLVQHIFRVLLHARRGDLEALRAVCTQCPIGVSCPLWQRVIGRQEGGHETPPAP